MKIGIDVNVETMKYMYISHQQDARQNHITKISNKPSDNREKFKYLGKTLKLQELMRGYLSAISPEPCSHTGVQKELN
jgi:hypothetical protein